MRHAIMVLGAAVLLAAVPARSQTLGITAGALFPVGDFGKQVDTSPYVGARCEIEGINDPFGQMASLNVLIEAGFAFLQNTEAASLLAPGSGDDGTYFDIGLGLRARPTESPFFLGVGASYLNLDVSDGEGSRSGFGAHLDLGVMMAQPTYQLEIGGRATLGIFEKDNIAHIQLLGAVAFPF